MQAGKARESAAPAFVQFRSAAREHAVERVYARESACVCRAQVSWECTRCCVHCC